MTSCVGKLNQQPITRPTLKTDGASFQRVKPFALPLFSNAGTDFSRLVSEKLTERIEAY